MFSTRPPPVALGLPSCRFSVRPTSRVAAVPQAYVRHPELAAAKANRDFVLRQVCQAVDTISDIANGRPPRASGDAELADAPGVLAAALDDFDVSLRLGKGCRADKGWGLPNVFFFFTGCGFCKELSMRFKS